MPIESPWDHNAECRFCDEQAMHRADCPWLQRIEMLAEHCSQLLAEKEQVITNQLRNLGELRAQLTTVEHAYAEDARVYLRQQEELVTANEKIEALRRKAEHYEQAHNLPDCCCPD